MYRTHTCGCLRACNVNQTVTLAGWVQKVRNLGAMTFIDLRDRYGITQIVVEEHSPAEARETVCRVGREWVIQVVGKVVERQSKNPKMPTGDIEVTAEKVAILHEAEVPPFTIEEVSDGGDEAFSKMTSDRIRPMMELFRRLQLQVLLISAVEKSTAIQPYCDITYSIVRHGDANAIAPFVRLAAE